MIPEENHPEGENPSFFSFLDDGARDHRHLPRGASIQHSSQAHLRSVLQRVLGDIPIACPNCDGICIDHSINLRDAFIRRLGVLAKKIVEGTDLYFRSRQFGVTEPSEVIEKIYSLASESSFVYALSEPQDNMDAHDHNDDQEDRGDKDEE